MNTVGKLVTTEQLANWLAMLMNTQDTILGTKDTGDVDIQFVDSHEDCVRIILRSTLYETDAYTLKVVPGANFGASDT